MGNPGRMVQNGENALEVTEGSLLDQILSQTRMNPEDEGYDIAKRGVGAFIAELLRPENQEQRVNKNLIDQMIDELDVQLSSQMDEILHNKDFKALESAWRGLQMLVNRTDFTQNIKIEVLNASKQDLYDDLQGHYTRLCG